MKPLDSKASNSYRPVQKIGYSAQNSLSSKTKKKTPKNNSLITKLIKKLSETKTREKSLTRGNLNWKVSIRAKNK